MLSKDKPIYDFKERDNLIWENFNDLIAVIEPTQNFKIEYINEEAFNDLLGFTRKDLIGRSFLKYIHSDDLMKYKDLDNKFAFGEQERELRIITKNGNYVWVELKIKTFKNEKNQQKLFIMLRDISRQKELEIELEESERRFEKIANLVSERKNMEVALRQNEAKFHTTIENLPFDFFMIDNDGKYVMQNATCKEHWGDIIGKRPEDVANDDNTLALWKSNNSRAFSGEIVTGEVEFEIKGNKSYFYNIISPVYIDNKIQGILGVNIEITGRKTAEQNIRESEEKYRHLYEKSPNAILLFNIKGEIIDCNLTSEKLSGFKRSELIRKNFKETSFIPKKYIPFVLEDFKVLLKGKIVEPREIQLYTKEGTLAWISYQALMFNYENEKIIQVIIQNITERKDAEEKLKESEEKYRSLFENMNAGFAYHEVIVDDNNKPIDYKYHEVNPAFEKLTGLKKEDLIGKTVTEAIPGTENDPADWIGKFGNVGLTGIPLIVEDYSEAINKWFKVSGYSPKKGYFAVTFTDITDRKQAEENLKESEAKYHELFEMSPDGVILSDLKGNILECNSALEGITGYSSKDFIGKNFMKLGIYHKNGLDILLEGYKDLLGEKLLEYVEFPIKRKDNKISWVQVRSTFIKMKAQTFILVVIHDITTQKKAEEALKKSEEKYRDLLETSSVGVMEIDVINRQVTYVNPKLLNIIGYAIEELTDVYVRDKIVHKKDLIKLLDSNEERELEFRITDKEGKQKWLSGKRIPHFNENGQISSIRIWVNDITEQKMYENLIYELNINFLNFTADIRNNIELLLNTCLQLLNGDLILYVHKSKSEGKEHFQIITSENEIYTYDSMEFSENLFISEIFYEDHDFPQTFFDIDRKKYHNSDPFIKNYKIKGCFGKVIKSQGEFGSAVCVYYKNNPNISGQDKLVLFLICDAIEIEQRRWQVQRDLEEQNITLDKINKLKTELFSRTSHELKTPLISIKGFTELLLTLHKSKLDTEVISILEEIEDGSKRLEKIINLLLESTKLEAGQLELNPSEEDLTFLIKFCVKELRGLASLRKQSIILDLHEKLIIEFDKERIYEVVSNLLVNAIKYTPPGGNIKIKSEINNNIYIISVQDDGIGFTEEEKSHIFQQFGKIERYGQGWDVATEGTGLGLFITKKLVELHGGKIWLESEGRNKGSTFYFSIPRK